MKLCVDCVHFEKDTISKEYGKCTKVWRTPPRHDLVTGRRLSGDHWFAATQRTAAGDCGHSGKLWQSRTPVVPVIIVKENNLEPKRPNIVKRACLRMLHLFRN